MARFSGNKKDGNIIKILFRPEQEKIAKETEKTYAKDDFHTFLIQRDTGEWSFEAIEHWNPKYLTTEELAENQRILQEIQQCDGLDGYLAKKIKERGIQSN